MKSLIVSRRALIVAASVLATLSVAPVATAAPDVPLPANHWRLDEKTHCKAHDVAAGRTAVLYNGASFAPGRDGNAVRLDGVDDYAVSNRVDIRTDQSFTVSAWVYLTAKNGGAVTAVSVDGDRTSKFQLGHILDDDNNQFGAWMFQGPESDSDLPVVTNVAVSTLPTELNTWVHLVGVYDEQAKRVWLYVDGVRVGDGTLNTPWQASGGLRLGAAKVQSEPAQFWPGSVDDVRLYQGTLTSDQISALYRSYPEA